LKTIGLSRKGRGPLCRQRGGSESKEKKKVVKSRSGVGGVFFSGGIGSADLSWQRKKKKRRARLSRRPDTMARPLPEGKRKAPARS